MGKLNINIPPVVIFSYKRVDSLRKTIESLCRCPEASMTDVYVYVDGPRNESEADEVAEVRNYVSNIETLYHFKSVRVCISPTNKGLSRSVIEGVGNVIRRHGSAIVLEDDLELLPNFLKFMCAGLDRFVDNKKVFSICAYSNRIHIPEGYEYDAYFCPRSSSWGWATWLDRWESIDWTFENWREWKKERKSFNKWGGSDCFSMLDACRKGKNSSWAIRFCFGQYLQDGVSLFPVKSLVINNGFDGRGSNCKRWSRFRCQLENPNKEGFKLPETTTVNQTIYRSVMRYHGLLLRALSKIMYIVRQ